MHNQLSETPGAIFLELLETLMAKYVTLIKVKKKYFFLIVEKIVHSSRCELCVEKEKKYKECKG